MLKVMGEKTTALPLFLEMRSAGIAPAWVANGRRTKLDTRTTRPPCQTPNSSHHSPSVCLRGAKPPN